MKSKRLVTTTERFQRKTATSRLDVSQLGTSYGRKVRSAKLSNPSKSSVGYEFFGGAGSGRGLLSNRAGYGNYGASYKKIGLEAWHAFSGSPDQDIIYNLPLLRRRSRDLFMGAPIAAAAILTLRTNVVGNGILPLPQIDGEFLGLDQEETAATNLLVKNEFNLFAESVECDWNRRSTFYELTDLAFCNMAISGDVLVLLPMKARKGSVYDTKVRLIEADRVMNPIEQVQMEGNTSEGALKLFGGVELTDDGEVAAYWISPVHSLSPYFTGLPGDYVRVDAFGAETGRPTALLVGEMERPEQRRAVPLMAKCLMELKQLQRYIESTTIQNVIKSYFAAFIESQMPSVDMFDRGMISEEDIGYIINQNPYDVKLGPGIVNWMRPGDSVKFPIGAGPPAEFEHYVVAIVKFIGACVGIPYEVLLKQFSASYSASRASLLEFWRRVKVLRKLIVNQFCQPVYVTWMMEAVAKGVIKAPGFFEDVRIQRAWTRCAWSGASPGSIDPLKEILASERKVKLGTSTLEIECLETNGSDWRANTIQQGIELDYATSEGLTYARNLDLRGQMIQGIAIPTTVEEELAQEEEAAQQQQQDLE
jgi:lambda family phage portal protein